MILKTKYDFESVKTAAKINTEVIQYAKSITKVGISGYEIDKKVEEMYKKKGVKSAFKGYQGYPATINFMINDQVLHCIPRKDQIVKDQDIISIDTGCIYNGYYADQAVSFGIGDISEEDKHLLYIGEISVKSACKIATSNRKTGDLAYAQQTIIEEAGFFVVREFAGHEIGKSLHDPLKIPSVGHKNTGEQLKENMLICIENQICVGSNKIYTQKDNWSTYTKNGGKSVTFEHMVIIKQDKPVILTLPN